MLDSLNGANRQLLSGRHPAIVITKSSSNASTELSARKGTRGLFDFGKLELRTGHFYLILTAIHSEKYIRLLSRSSTKKNV